MNYSPELINEVKALYPNDKKMIEYAENGEKDLGRRLDEESPLGMMLDEVIDATSLEELQKEARLRIRRVELFNNWRKEYNAKLRSKIE